MRCAVNSRRCLIQPALLEVDTRQVEGAMPRVDCFDPFKNLFGLSQLALAGTAVAFPQQADTVVVPALPLRYRAACIGIDGQAVFDG